MKSSLLLGPWILAMTWPLTGVGIAQEVYLTLDGRAFDYMGLGVSGAADVNGDGHPELVVGAPHGGPTHRGLVVVLSGVDGTPAAGPALGGNNEALGVTVTGLGDFDGDGVPDFAGGDQLDAGTDNGKVIVFSGVDAAPITTLTIPEFAKRFGQRIWCAGDLDGDGLNEVAATAQYKTGLYIFKGPQGTILREHDVPGIVDPPFASIGDIDGDGSPEYIIGWRGTSLVKPIGGLAQVHSGKTGTVILRVVGDDLSYFGAGVAGLADVNGDAIPDFAVGAPGCLDNQTKVTCTKETVKRGWVRIYSGADASILRHIDGPGPDPYEIGAFGINLAGGGDVNGDGCGDLLVSGTMEHLGEGAITVVSGRTGTFLWKVRREKLSPTSNNYGMRMAMLGDLDGDGDDEFAHGDFWADFQGQDSGRVWVFEGFPGDAENVCTTSPNSVGDGARLALYGPISRGNNELRLQVGGAVPGQVGHFLYGPEEANQPFGDGVLCVGGGAVGIVRLGPLVTIDAGGAGELAVDFTKPPLKDGPRAWQAGSTWVVQFVYRDPGGPLGSGVNLSDAVRITFTP